MFAEWNALRAGLPGLVVLLALAAGPARSQTLAAKTGGALTFVFDWPAQNLPHYEITVAADGTGTYRSGAPGPPEANGPSSQPIWLSQTAMEHIEPAAAVLSAGKPCETSQKKIAQTGTKMLRLERAGAAVTCTYNYSEDKRIQEATATFQAIAVTMQEAPRLEHLHRFDRLGLDAELAIFVQSVREGRAIEVGNIAATLRSLAADNDLMERVRSRAADLLQHVASTPAT